MVVTTTLDLNVDSLTEVERLLAGMRNRAGRRVTKRLFFQTVLDDLLSDEARRDELINRLIEASND